MKNKGKLFNFLFSGIFMVVGVALLIGGVVTLILSRNFMEKAEEITAVITDISSYRNSDGELSHNVQVEYTYGGILYENIELHFYSSSMYEGKEITLLCDPEHPEHVESNGGMAILYGIFIGMGLLFIIIAIIPITITLRGSARRKRILKSGRKLYAAIEEITLNTSLSVNGQHPYVIYCTWKDEYKDMVYRFKSSSIWTNPNLVLHPGDMIPVYVDEKNYKHYYVDIESVLNNRIVDYT